MFTLSPSHHHTFTFTFTFISHLRTRWRDLVCRTEGIQVKQASKQAGVLGCACLGTCVFRLTSLLAFKSVSQSVSVISRSRPALTPPSYNTLVSKGWGSAGSPSGSAAPGLTHE